MCIRDRIETGPWPGADPDRMLVKLNFVALITALDAIASGTVDNADPGVYERLPENDALLLHTIVRGATVLAGTRVPPFRADIGLAGTRVVRRTAGRRTLQWQASIQEIGDLRVYGALQTIDGDGLFVSAVYSAARVGDEVVIPDAVRAASGAVGAAAPAGPTVTLGAPARLWLLRAGSLPGRYRIERVIEVR